MMVEHWPSFWLGVFAPSLLFFGVMIVAALIGDLINAIDAGFDWLMTEPTPPELDDNVEVLR